MSRSLLSVLLVLSMPLGIMGKSGDVPEANPAAIDKCMESEGLREVAKISKTTNPYYLRGDFDGDSKPDYAVEISLIKDGKLRVAVCLGSGKSYLLGDDKAIFSDMEDDNYFAPIWLVYTIHEGRSLLRRANCNLTSLRKLRLRGEVIVMWWDDASAIIYWDGRQFRWTFTFGLEGCGQSGAGVRR